MFGAKILTANLDNSVCLGVWRFNNLLERILCGASFRIFTYRLIDHFTWRIRRKLAEAKRDVRRE